jgi:hypothetical protein
MTHNPFVIVQYYHGLGIRTRGPYPQEFGIETWQVSAVLPWSRHSSRLCRVTPLALSNSISWCDRADSAPGQRR